jgi:hypothetical protein
VNGVLVPHTVVCFARVIAGSSACFAREKQRHAKLASLLQIGDFRYGNRILAPHTVAAVAWPSWRLTKGHPAIKLLAWPAWPLKFPLFGQESIRRD